MSGLTSATLMQVMASINETSYFYNGVEATAEQEVLMTELNSPQFYALRERQARELAAKAASPAIARIHLELASRYAELRAHTSETSQRPKLSIASG